MLLMESYHDANYLDEMENIIEGPQSEGLIIISLFGEKLLLFSKFYYSRFSRKPVHLLRLLNLCIYCYHITQDKYISFAITVSET